MGAVEKSDNIKVRNKKKNVTLKQKFSKSSTNCNGQYPPSSRQVFPPFTSIMRARPSFPPGRMPHPGMRPPLPGMRMPPPPGPPPLFRNRVPPPIRMGLRGAAPPMNIRPRPPVMGPIIRPPPPMMGGPRRFPPPPPNMLPPNNKIRQLKNRINSNKRNKRKVNVQNQIDLCSPWITQEIKTEFFNKDKLYQMAKESNKTDDWEKFKNQRTKCDKMYRAAKMEYIGKHPEEESDDKSKEQSEEHYESSSNSYDQNSVHFCDACEKSFLTSEQLQFHLQEHTVCGIDGCKFIAHSKIIEKHINMQHISGLYYRISQSDSPEDIKKWIEERKKRYPTKENIEKRQKQQEEMITRGERLSKNNERFGRRIKKETWCKKNKQIKKKRFKNKRKSVLCSKQSAVLEKILPSLSLLNCKSNWNGNLPQFCGTSDLYALEKEIECENKFNDDEWLEENQKTDNKNNNALEALIGAYKYSDESEEELSEIETKPIVLNQELDKAVEDNSNNEDKSTFDEKPEEQKIIKNLNSPQYLESNEKEIMNNKFHKNRKRKRKNCNENTVKTKTIENKISNQKSYFRKITLLERLLAPEIKHERNLILQCIRYTVDNHFFEKREIVTTQSEVDSSPVPAEN